MTESDVFAFQALTKRVGSAFQKRTDTEEFKSLTSTYFRALQRFSVPELERAADAWIATEQKFPLVPQWRAKVTARLPVEILVLTEHDSRELMRAERLGYDEVDPCTCAACVAAGVPDRADSRSRYVPLEDADGHVLRAKNAVTGQIVTPGRWLHGFELVRWHQARANFWGEVYAKRALSDKDKKHLKALPFAKRVARILTLAEQSKRTARELAAESYIHDTKEPAE